MPVRDVVLKLIDADLQRSQMQIFFYKLRKPSLKKSSILLAL